MSGKQILVVDDEINVRRLLVEVLKKDGHGVHTAENGRQALEMMGKSAFDLVLMDIKMPVMGGMETIDIMVADYPDTPVIIMTAFAGVDTAVQAMKAGAYNYISKPFDNADIRENVRKALEIKDLTREADDPFREEVRGQFSINKIVGKSAKMQEVYKTIGKVAESNATILIQGESGTGKELVAKAIHYNSPRSNEQLVSVNCASIPDGLLESELFGHAKGSFSGAYDNKIGKFEYASRGTIFLDEIGEMNPLFQAKLLKVIQDRSFQRVGGLQTIAVDVRIIAATNRDLWQMVGAGSFREDLYYRLNVVQINMPPLRERREDIPWLVEHFIAKYNKEMGKSVKCVSPEVMDLFNAYDWAGNVRELENAIERAVVMGSGKLVAKEELPAQIKAFERDVTRLPDFKGKSLKEILQAVEKKVIRAALAENGWNRVKTADALKMSRKALIYKIDTYGLAPNKPDTPEPGQPDQ